MLTNYSCVKFESDIKNNNALVPGECTHVSKQACCDVDCKYYSDIRYTEDIGLIDYKKDENMWVK